MAQSLADLTGIPVASKLTLGKGIALGIDGNIDNAVNYNGLGDVYARKGSLSQVRVGDIFGTGVAGITFGSAGDTTINRVTASTLGTSQAFRVYGNSGVDRYWSFGDGRLDLGGSADASTLQMNIGKVVSGTPGIIAGGDTNLYRVAANNWKTDDAFYAVGDIVANYGGATSQVWLNPSGIINFGSPADTNIYRGGANLLQTDDDFQVAGNVFLDPVGSGKSIQFGSSSPVVLYRSASNVLTTDQNFTVANYIGLDLGDNLQPIYWGSAQDVNLYRSGANKLKTDDGLTVSLALVQKRVILTYGSTVATDASLGNVFYISVTNTSNWTLSNPTNPTDGQVICYIIKAATGGSTFGTVTPGAAFKSQPSIDFHPLTSTGYFSVWYAYDGTTWIQVGRENAS